MSTFLKEQTEKRLKELRYNCGLQRLYLRNASEKRWARAARSTEENQRDCGSSDKYWDDVQAKSLTKAASGIAEADKLLAEFIAEHRAMMWPE